MKIPFDSMRDNDFTLTNDRRAQMIGNSGLRVTTRSQLRRSQSSSLRITPLAAVASQCVRSTR